MHSSYSDEMNETQNLFHIYYWFLFKTLLKIKANTFFLDRTKIPYFLFLSSIKFPVGGGGVQYFLVDSHNLDQNWNKLLLVNQNLKQNWAFFFNQNLRKNVQQIFCLWSGTVVRKLETFRSKGRTGVMLHFICFIWLIRIWNKLEKTISCHLSIELQDEIRAKCFL